MFGGAQDIGGRAAQDDGGLGVGLRRNILCAASGIAYGIEEVLRAGRGGLECPALPVGKWEQVENGLHSEPPCGAFEMIVYLAGKK